ncbi:MAG: ribosome maturation factor RimM, partial [Bacteroidota bacterium]
MHHSAEKTDGAMIAVGQIVKSNGIRGELRVRPLTEDLQRFATLKSVWIGEAEGETKRFPIQEMRFHRSLLILKLQDVQSRDAADELKDQFLFVEERNALEPAAGSFFIHDIVGMEVSTEDGTVVGA